MPKPHQEPVVNKLRKGPWQEEEDEQLVSFVSVFGERKWDFIATASGLRRTGKSCRLRWLNYLRPNLKRGQISEEEEHIIIQLHQLWGNKWAKIARRLPGRTDNDVKNYCRTHLKKKLQPQQGNKCKEELLSEKENTISWWNYSTQDCKSMEAMNMGTNYEKSNLIKSPYENWSYDNWMSQLSSTGDYEIMRLNHDFKACNCFDYCVCCLNFHGQEDGDNVTILDSMGTLWDFS